jgi:hypothetical protein
VKHGGVVDGLVARTKRRVVVDVTTRARWRLQLRVVVAAQVVAATT